tara:strand:- start:16091 stop:17203 length:1113 start_codon:yes stop_codon:yes gene_type:complete
MALFEENIYFGSPVHQFKAHRDEILSAIEDVCDGPFHILGPKVEKFEQGFAAWNNTKYAVGVGSGTDALRLTIEAFGIGKGDEVITVSHTALATASAVLSAGATPVLVDVKQSTCTLDVDKLKSALTPKTKAIMPVHLYGFPCDMDAILDFAKEHSLVVIEDCAQAHGALYKGKKVGSIGDAGCFSFYPTKNLGAIGDGGGVITDNKEIADKVRQLRQYGWDENRVGQIQSVVSRLDPLQASVLSVKLKYLEADVQKRRDIAAEYDRLIDWQNFDKPVALADTEPSYHLYVIMSDRRQEIIEKFKEQNVFLGIHYEHSVHKNPGYQDGIVVPKDGLTTTDHLSSVVLSLPIYPELPLSAVQKITEFLNEF